MAQPSQTFIRGTVVLSAAAFINRILGFVSGIFVARMLGAEGIGLLMMAHPLVPFVITITEFGLPVAISKLVAEAQTRGERMKVRHILHVSLAVTAVLSMTLTTVSLFGSRWIASVLLPDPRAYYAMVAITPIAPVVAVSAVLKGYFRGIQRMKTIAASEVIEQTVQTAAVLALVYVLLPYGIAIAAAGAMTAAVISEGVSLLFLIASYKVYGERRDAGETWLGHLKRGRRTLAELLQIGVPTTGHNIVQSLYGAFQPLLITTSLALAGVGTAMATKQFGLIAGYAFPLLFMPSFVTHSLSTALIPAISEAAAERNSRLIHRRMDQALRLGLLIGVPATVVLFGWATPLTSLVYNAPEAGILLRILAPMFLLYYFEAPLYAVMLGLGRANLLLWNFLVATACKALAIYVFGSRFGIDGVAFGLGVGIAMQTLLNFLSLSKLIGFYVEIRPYGKVAIAAALMAACGRWSFGYFAAHGQILLWNVVFSVAISLLVYLLALNFMGVSGRDRRRPAFLLPR